MSGHTTVTASPTGAGMETSKEISFLVNMDGFRDDAGVSHVISTSGATADCAICDIQEGVFGVVQQLRVRCLETPTGAGAVIDFYLSDNSGGQQGSDVPGSSVVVLTRGLTTWTLGAEEWSNSSHLQSASLRFLYMVHRDGATGDYTAGKFLVTFFCRV